MVNFKFAELLGSGIMDLFGSYLLRFSTKAMCQDIIEEVFSKPDAVRC